MALTITVIIEKATPEISVTADPINYGQALKDSNLTGSAAYEGNVVNGSFKWDDDTIQPSVPESGNTEYTVIFTPTDSTNYNTVTPQITVIVNKVDPKYIPPAANTLTYTGIAQELVIPGSSDEGTVKYWLANDATADTPDPEAVYSATVPSRANAGSYRAWYMVLGDENHNDIVSRFIDVTVKPYELPILEQRFTYNGGNELKVTLSGVNSETVTVTLTSASANVGVYTYAAGDNSYAAVIEASNNTNYVVAEASGDLTIDKLSVILAWSETLTFEYDDDTEHEVTATVSNKIGGDTVGLTYREGEADGVNYAYKATDVGSYTADVIELDNPNYTLEGGQNLSQLWRIYEADDAVTLEVAPVSGDAIVYGGELELTAKITLVSPESAAGALVAEVKAAEQNKVDFYANGYLIGTGEVVTADDGESVTVTLTASSAAPGEYTYKAESNGYTADSKDSNYVITDGGLMTIIKPTPDDPDNPTDPDNPDDPNNPDNPTEPKPEAKQYIIFFDANGGECGTYSMKTKEDGTLQMLPTAKREGLYFAGWYTDREGGTRVTLLTVFSTDTTLYAHWSKTPVTGAESNIALWGALLGVSALYIIGGGIFLLGKKGKKTEESKA